MAIELSPDVIGSNSKFEVMRKNIFEVVIGDLNADDIRLAIMSFPFPKFGVGEITVGYKNANIKLAGRSKLDQDMEMKCRDTVDGKVRNQLWEWMMKVYDPRTGKVGLQQDYKKDGKLVMAGPDGSSEQVWSLFGMWPKAGNFGDGDTSAEGPVEISVTFSVDSIVKD